MSSTVAAANGCWSRFLANERLTIADDGSAAGAQWRICADTGGTFTDCVAESPTGEIRRTKVLSSSRLRAAVQARSPAGFVTLGASWNLPPGFFRGTTLLAVGSSDRQWAVRDSRSADATVELECEQPTGDLQVGQAVEIVSGREAPILAAHWVTRTPLDQDLPSSTLRLATTRGTNALLERKGSPTALFITAGFGDLLVIGDQQRPDLFALDVVSRVPLYECVVEVPERLDSSGRVLTPINLGALRPQALELLNRGIRSAAVALLHSYLNPVHEESLAALLLDLGFDHVSSSADLAPRIKIVPRAETAVVNAYLHEVIGSYLRAVEATIVPGPVHVLTSAGGLVRSDDYLPKDSLLSGPAGGVVGASAMAKLSGWDRSLAFDMGGTSTDVSRYDGQMDYRFETTIGDVRLLSPSLAIETVAAGGGSICHFDGRQLKVGPQSAGADPGPACYGAGGPLTLTDVNLLLGRLRAESFEIPISRRVAEEAFRQLLVELGSDGTEGSHEEILQGLLDIANERMAEAIRRISIRQGYLPGEYALVAFGGAGGQHACALAEILDMKTILVPEDAGLLSAVGLGQALVERFAECQVLQPLSDMAEHLEARLQELAQAAHDAVLAEGVPATDVRTVRTLAFLRLAGQETTLAVDAEDLPSLANRFATLYEDHYGYQPEGAVIEVESLRVMAASGEQESESVPAEIDSRRAETREGQSVFVGGSWRSVPVFRRERLRPGDSMRGPALIFERHCATLVDPGWWGRIDAHRCLVLELDVAVLEGAADET